LEATGTPLGGGALKIETTHLRRVPLPRPSGTFLRDLDDALTRSEDLELAAAEVDHLVFESIAQALQVSPRRLGATVTDELATRQSMRYSTGSVHLAGPIVK
jgi:hypothetical protein